MDGVKAPKQLVKLSLDGKQRDLQALIARVEFPCDCLSHDKPLVKLVVALLLAWEL